MTAKQQAIVLFNDAKRFNFTGLVIFFIEKQKIVNFPNQEIKNET